MRKPLRGITIVCLVVFWLCQMTDAVMTLWLLRHGAREVNPLMNWLIRRSEVGAVAFKFVVGTGLVACMAWHGDSALVRRGAWFVMGIYVALVIWLNIVRVHGLGL